MVIRPADDDDWPLIWPIFSATVSAGETYAYPIDLTADTGRGWWMESPPGRTVVAVEGAAVLGSAKMGPNRPGRGDHVATASFMVDPVARGRGVGMALGAHVLAWATDEGFRGMQFNAVVETNPAVRLWESLGFEVIGTVPEAFRHPANGLVGLHVMYKRLPSG